MRTDPPLAALSTRADATATPSAGPPLTVAERDALHARAPELVYASVERLALRFERHELGALWALLDARRAASPEELAARVNEALAAARSLAAYADASNECGPGFPRDDPGPWHWSCLASLTRAAALARTSPHEALFVVDGAAFAATYPSGALQESERAWRRAQLA